MGSPDYVVASSGRVVYSRAVTAIAPEVTEKLTHAPDIIHVECCRDDNLALCGVEVDGSETVMQLPDCVVCCDLFLSDGCPVYGGPCPED